MASKMAERRAWRAHSQRAPLLCHDTGAGASASGNGKAVGRGHARARTYRRAMSEFVHTQNSILRISDEKTLQLIELYEQEQCLWNTHIPEYKSREKRQKASERIARKLDIRHFEARHVVIKFKNLRNSYCQELKKIASSISLGDDDPYRPKVFWFTKMDSFLRPHLQPARAAQSVSIVRVLENEQVKSEPEADIDSDSNLNSEDYCIKDDSVNSFPIVALDVDDSIHSEEGPPMKRRALRYSSSSSRMRDVSHSFGQRDLDLAKTVKDLEAKIQALTDERKEDYYDSFGKYIASLLRSLPKEKAMLLQPKVISLIVSGSGLGDGSVSQSDI